jgi:hypothetical protein
VLARQPEEYDRITLLRATIPASRIMATSIMRELAHLKQDDRADHTTST